MTTPSPSLTDARSAGALISFGLQFRQRPTDGTEYGALLRRYRHELAFRDLVDATASGLGLIVLGTPAAGLALAPQPGSVFSGQMTDLRNLNAEDRLIRGLVLVALAAYAFPTGTDLDEIAVKAVSADQLDAFLTAAIKPLLAMNADDASQIGRSKAAAMIYDKRPPLGHTDAGAPQRNSRTAAIVDVFTWLAKQGAAREVANLGPRTYHLTDRFRLLVADLAGNEALTALRGLAQTKGTHA